MNITVAGVGYASWSLALLLSQHREVSGITTTEKKQKNRILLLVSFKIHLIQGLLNSFRETVNNQKLRCIFYETV